MTQKASNQEQPILPRSPWKEQRAWLKLIVKTKKALDEAETKVLQQANLV